MNDDFQVRLDEERFFLKSLRSYDEELASAGRVYLETVRASARLKAACGDRCVSIFGVAESPEEAVALIGDKLAAATAGS